MYEDIKLVKLVSGDTVMGIYKDETIHEVVLIQIIPTATGGVQLAILPFGFPFEEELKGKVAARHIMYEYSKVPDELSKKYMEAKSNIRIASSMDGLGGRNTGGGILL